MVGPPIAPRLFEPRHVGSGRLRRVWAYVDGHPLAPSSDVTNSVNSAMFYDVALQSVCQITFEIEGARCIPHGYEVESVFADASCEQPLGYHQFNASYLELCLARPGAIDLSRVWPFIYPWFPAGPGRLVVNDAVVPTPAYVRYPYEVDGCHEINWLDPNEPLYDVVPVDLDWATLEALLPTP